MKLLKRAVCILLAALSFAGAAHAQGAGSGGFDGLVESVTIEGTGTYPKILLKITNNGQICSDGLVNGTAWTATNYSNYQQVLHFAQIAKAIGTPLYGWASPDGSNGCRITMISVKIN